jgi:hypothetical protein
VDSVVCGQAAAAATKPGGAAMIKHVLLIAALLTFAGVTETQAAMGLTCDQWLNARAYLRFDPQTGKIYDARPASVPPVSAEVDTLVAEASYYMAGHAATLMLLDEWLAKLAPTGIQVPTSTPDSLDEELRFVDKLCRGSPQDDTLDVISLRNKGTLMVRVLAIQDLLSAYMARGREQGTQGGK